jgi:hypothetical protein
LRGWRIIGIVRLSPIANMLLTTNNTRDIFAMASKKPGSVTFVPP